MKQGTCAPPITGTDLDLHGAADTLSSTCTELPGSSCSASANSSSSSDQDHDVMSSTATTTTITYMGSFQTYSQEPDVILDQHLAKQLICSSCLCFPLWFLVPHSLKPSQVAYGSNFSSATSKPPVAPHVAWIFDSSPTCGVVCGCCVTMKSSTCGGCLQICRQSAVGSNVLLGRAFWTGFFGFFHILVLTVVAQALPFLWSDLRLALPAYYIGFSSLSWLFWTKAMMDVYFPDVDLVEVCGKNFFLGGSKGADYTVAAGASKSSSLARSCARRCGVGLKEETGNVLSKGVEPLPLSPGLRARSGGATPGDGEEYSVPADAGAALTSSTPGSSPERVPLVTPGSFGPYDDFSGRAEQRAGYAGEGSTSLARRFLVGAPVRAEAMIGNTNSHVDVESFFSDAELRKVGLVRFHKNSPGGVATRNCLRLHGLFRITFGFCYFWCCLFTSITVASFGSPGRVPEQVYPWSIDPFSPTRVLPPTLVHSTNDGTAGTKAIEHSAPQEWRYRGRFAVDTVNGDQVVFPTAGGLSTSEIYEKTYGLYWTNHEHYNDIVRDYWRTQLSPSERLFMSGLHDHEKPGDHWDNSHLSDADARRSGYDVSFQFEFCPTAKVWKPYYHSRGVHHCRICHHCTTGFDHHCPFVGNCVGSGNYKAFALFLFYAFTWGLFAIYTLGCESAPFLFNNPLSDLEYELHLSYSRPCRLQTLHEFHQEVIAAEIADQRLSVRAQAFGYGGVVTGAFPQSSHCNFHSGSTSRGQKQDQVVEQDYVGKNLNHRGCSYYNAELQQLPKPVPRYIFPRMYSWCRDVFLAGAYVPHRRREYTTKVWQDHRPHAGGELLRADYHDASFAEELEREDAHVANSVSGGSGGERKRGITKYQPICRSTSVGAQGESANYSNSNSHSRIATATRILSPEALENERSSRKQRGEGFLAEEITRLETEYRVTKSVFRVRTAFQLASTVMFVLWWGFMMFFPGLMIMGQMPKLGMLWPLAMMGVVQPTKEHYELFGGDPTKGEPGYCLWLPLDACKPYGTRTAQEYAWKKAKKTEQEMLASSAPTPPEKFLGNAFSAVSSTPSFVEVEVDQWAGLAESF